MTAALICSSLLGVVRAGGISSVLSRVLVELLPNSHSSLNYSPGFGEEKSLQLLLGLQLLLEDAQSLAVFKRLSS